MSDSRLDSFRTEELLREVAYREAMEIDIDGDGILDRPQMSHTACVDAAAKYMQKRSQVVLPEFYTWNAELPDVIAFNRDYSTVIECKVSRADFLKDKKKPFRINPNSGMGDLRYYCAPKGLIKPEELPQYWGLLEVYGNGIVRKRVESSCGYRKNVDAEHHLLFYYARRAYFAGVHKVVLEYRGTDS